MARAVTLLTERYQKRQQVLCLPPATGELPETGGIIVSSPATPIRKTIEHAGHLYQEKVIRLYSLNPVETDDDDSSNDQSSTNNDNANGSSTATPSKTKSSAETASTLASKMAIGSDDLYELLELGDKRWHATADDIKKSFRRLSLTYHPDKIAHMGEEARLNSESHFKSVMKAYDILSDKKKRAAYDSIDDVDDSIPTERDATTSPERFYEKFGECFALNARWSTANRVPELGDDNTELKKVNDFYDFWYSFKSWRDFSFDLEYNTDQAECREEKRWMERQNSKHVKAKKLEESARIRRLVDLACKHDPRLQRERAANKAQKDKKKAEKRKIAEERERQEKEKLEEQKKAQEIQEAEEKEKRAVAKKQRENARQVMRKARQQLRGMSKNMDLIATERGGFIVEKMCMEGTIESIIAVTSRISSLKDDMAVKNDTDSKLVEKALEILELAAQNPREPLENAVEGNSTSSKTSEKPTSQSQPPPSSDKSRNGHASNSTEHNHSKASGNSTRSSSSQTQWTVDELSILSKGVAKFPGGTRDRWQKLADLIGTKTPEEVLKKVNESRASKISANASAQSALSAKKEEVKAFERFQEKKKSSSRSAYASSSASPSKSTPPSKSTSPAKDKTKTANGSGDTNGSANVTSRSQPPNKLQFSPKEQTLFEAALKKFPASEGDNRWKKVSSTVGRNPSECQQRFKELIAFFQAKNRK